MSERELRELLHRVVPEAPALVPTGLAEAGKRARSRRRLAGAVSVAALATCAAMLLPAVLTDRAEPPPVVDFAPPPDPVYSAVPCPPVLPDSRTANKVLPDLDAVVGVRLCGDATEPGPGSTLGSGSSFPASPEALVHGVQGFVSAVRALPVPDPDRCATVDGVSSRQSLALLMRDGSTLLLGQTFCGDNLVEGQQVDAGSVVRAFLDALDTQRDEHHYGLRVDVTCQTPLTNAPAVPGREQIIGAEACDGDGLDLGPVTGEALARLQDAWGNPQPVTEELNEVDENVCTDGRADMREVVLSTDRGDVVRLFPSPCGYLVFDDWRPGQSVRIPATLVDLGVN